MAIVIADDDEQVRRSLRKLLKLAGLVVVGEASNGGEALAMVEVLRPQVVLMDGKMPLMNGLVATRYLKSLHPEVKVIAHTSDPSMAQQMVALGATAWVTKGLQKDLVDAISAAYGETPA